VNQTGRFARSGVEPTGREGVADVLADAAERAVDAAADRSVARRLVEEGARVGNAPTEWVEAACRAVEMLEAALRTHAGVVDPGRVRDPDRADRDPVPEALAGAWMIGRGSELVAGCGDAGVTEWSACAHRMVRAQMLEFEDLYDAARAPSRWLQVARMRTGELYALAARLGSVRAGDERLSAALGDYGRELGVATEVGDDLAALEGARAGRRTGPGIGAGNYTLPLLYALEQDPALAGRLGRPLEPAEVSEVVAAIRGAGGSARADEERLRRVESAKRALRGIASAELADLADEVARR
jgi:heptaprenyl diphosphate synthase